MRQDEIKRLQEEVQQIIIEEQNKQKFNLEQEVLEQSFEESYEEYEEDESEEMSEQEQQLEQQ